MFVHLYPEQDTNQFDHRKQFEGEMIDHRKQFGGQMIDYRKRFEWEMIALMIGKPV